MKTGILVAMQEEITDLLGSMQSVQQETFGQKTVYIGTLFDSDVVLCLSGVSKSNAALATGILKAKYDVDMIIMTGIAGSAQPSIHVGDIIVSNLFVQHDVDSRPNFPQFVVPFTENALIPADNTLNQNAVKACEQFARNINTHLSAELLTQLNITRPSVHSGLMGSGDKFISEVNTINTLKAEIQKALAEDLLCVDMEAAAVAVCCKSLNVPFICIKTISDCPFLNNSVTDYHTFKKQIATPYCHLILAELFKVLKQNG